MVRDCLEKVIKDILVRYVEQLKCSKDGGIVDDVVLVWTDKPLIITGAAFFDRALSECH